MTEVFTRRAITFMERASDQPFFLFFCLHQPHVPRLPSQRFVGKSQCGLRGDAVVEADWAVGELLGALERLGVRENTLVIFSSDNGPVITDGYDDGALAQVGEHRPAGPFRGGKYQAWEGGTRLPLLVSWSARVQPTVSSALISQVDLLASLAALVGSDEPPGAAVDSKNVLPALLGESQSGRKSLLGQAPQVVWIRRGDWKYIPAGPRSGFAEEKHAQPGDPTGSARLPRGAQLFNLALDPPNRFAPEPT